MHLATGNWHTCIYANCQKLACSRSRSRSRCEQLYGCRCMYVLRAAVCINTYKYLFVYNVGQFALVRIAVGVGVGVGAAVNNRSTHFRRLSHCIICSHYNPLSIFSDDTIDYCNDHHHCMRVNLKWNTIIVLASFFLFTKLHPFVARTGHFHFDNLTSLSFIQILRTFTILYNVNT